MSGKTCSECGYNGPKTWKVVDDGVKCPECGSLE